MLAARSTLALLGVLTTFSAAAEASAQRLIEVEFTPTRRAQLAIWIATEDGRYLATLGLTQSVARYGIGNRPGALQMNSGFRWPYGRREGVLPVWAHARASAPGAALFPRVIFQDRTSEGHASRSSNDPSRDDYFCLSFNASASARNALDAVTCPSPFNSDKGRYLRETDVAAGYLEPSESAPGVFAARRLDLFSLYPPRRDVRRCTSPGCFDHADVDRFASDARTVMPEIDTITMATPPETPQTLRFTVPEDWTNGRYDLYVEVNVEGDYAPGWDAERHPTPRAQGSRANEQWDYWAMTYGYPYRGQPSVVYRVPVVIGETGSQTATRAEIVGSLDGSHGGVPMDATIVDDPARSPGSGHDRLRARAGGVRLIVRSQSAEACRTNSPPDQVTQAVVTQYHERRDAHRFAHLTFTAPADDSAVVAYQVRVSEEPITDAASFERARPANAASLDIEALEVPTSAAPGDAIEVDFGGLSYERHYWVGVRAVDACNAPGALAIAEFTTPAVEFTTVSPCFVATAAYGTPMAEEIGPLRRFRDRYLRTNALGEAAVRAYYTLGPSLARWIAEDDDRRATTRAWLAPVVDVAGWLTGVR